MTSLLATHLPRLAGHLFPDLVWRIPTRERVAYLTFDDGPTRRLTAPLLDLLGRYGAGATFFLLGKHALRDAGLVRAIHAAGHTIGNHTFTHPDAWFASAARVLGELDRTTALLEDQVQESIHWMRPPYGRFTRPMRDWCLARSQHLTMWDVMPGDYLPSTTAVNLERRLLRGTRPGSIVVLHDNVKAEHCLLTALEAVLERLSGAGWQFLPLHKVSRL